MPENLDYFAASHAQAIVRRSAQGGASAEEVDSLVTKALGVLQEHGIYASILFLLSRSRERDRLIAKVVKEEMLSLLSALPFAWGRPTSESNDSVLEYISTTVTGDARLERVLLAKETLEQLLIYARYGAKARKAESA